MHVKHTPKGDKHCLVTSKCKFHWVISLGRVLKNKLPVIPQQKPFASLFNIGRAKSLEELSHFFLDFWQSNGVVVFSHGLEPGDEHFIGFLGTNHRSCPYVHCQWSTCSKKGFIDHWETLMHFYTH